MSDTQPERVGPYQIEDRLGEGGMGTVYRALDTRLNRLVAIKFLASDRADVAALRVESEIAKLPRVRTIDAPDATPGPSADVFAFSRERIQRNLYRIPLP